MKQAIIRQIDLWLSDVEREHRKTLKPSGKQLTLITFAKGRVEDLAESLANLIKEK